MENEEGSARRRAKLLWAQSWLRGDGAPLHGACPTRSVCLPAPRLCGAWTASLGTAQAAAGPGRQEERLTADIIALARQYGRYGYRKVAALLHNVAGWLVGYLPSW